MQLLPLLVIFMFRNSAFNFNRSKPTRTLSKRGACLSRGCADVDPRANPEIDWLPVLDPPSTATPTSNYKEEFEVELREMKRAHSSRFVQSTRQPSPKPTSKRGIKTDIYGDNPYWHSIDGPLFVEGGRIAHWIMFKRKSTISPIRVSKSFKAFVPPASFFDLSRFAGGNQGWSELNGPFEDDEKNVHWFKFRKANGKDELVPPILLDKLMDIAGPLYKLLKEAK